MANWPYEKYPEALAQAAKAVIDSFNFSVVGREVRDAHGKRLPPENAAAIYALYQLMKGPTV